MNKIAGWKDALKEVSCLHGMELQDGCEAKFIKKIVQVVDDKLKRLALNVPAHLIGFHDRARKINKWLQDGSTEVGILAIYGTGGIGKTTIAKQVYNLNYRRFEIGCFLENVRETLENSEGLLCLYKNILLHMLKQDKLKIRSPDEGLNKIRDVTSCKKILFVLDDVDQKNKLKLDALLSMHRSFFPGSKIIVTTRHKQLLQDHKVYVEDQLQEFDVHESLELFSWHAFGQDFPIEEYSELSRRIVSYCGGLPLALHVLGSSLCGKSLDVWESTIEKLKEFPDPEILRVLRVSYDCLPHDDDKNLFLEIACFFVGEEKSYVVTILNACGFHTMVGLDNLIIRSLVTIDNCDKLEMHQLLQDVGREIVRQESPKKLGERSRLWHHEDSFNVLKEKTGTETIEGLMLSMDVLKEDKTFLTSCNINHMDDMYLETDAFNRMCNLRLLQINNVQLIGGYKQFPKKLKFLSWRGCPWRYMPRDFPLDNVVAIDLCNSNIKQLPTGSKVLRHVKILNLSHCHLLAKTQEFSKFPNLEKLILEDCISLVEVHESIVEVEGLLLLNLNGCQSLRKLPHNIIRLKALETLIISGCSNLEDLPKDMKEMECLKRFWVDGITLTISQPTTEGEISWRDLMGSLILKSTRVLPILSWDSLPRSLVSLHLADCNLSNNDFPPDFYNMPLLQDIDLSTNPISFLPDCVKHFTKLIRLDLSGCKRLQTLIGLPVTKRLNAWDCGLLEKVSFQTNWQDSFIESSLLRENFIDLKFFIKILPIGKINARMLNYFVLHAYNLRSTDRIAMILYELRTQKGRKGPIQSAYGSSCLLSIYLPGDSNIVPSTFTYRTDGQSVPFTVPSSPPNTRIRSLIMRVMYARHPTHWNPVQFTNLFVEVSNDTKDIRWDICAAANCTDPDEGKDIIWVTRWDLGSHHLEAGDEMHAVVYSAYVSTELPAFEIKQVGIGFMAARSNTREGVGLKMLL